MTTIYAAAAWHTKRTVTIATIAATLGLGLAGCGSSGNLLGESTTTAAPAVVQAPPPPAPEVGRIALAAPIGAPDAVAQRLSDQMTAALETRKIKVVKSGEASDFTLRGYIVAAKEKSATKVSYIYDVTDSAGRRVNRFSGEEIVPAAQGADAWAATTPQLTQTIADKTAGQLAGWLPSQKAGGIAQGGPPAAVGAPTPAQTASASSAQGSLQTASAASVGTAAVTVVPSVTGAPGDGNRSLAAAIERELGRNGVSPSASNDPNAYRVEAKVALGAAKEGKQPIQIDWQVKDAKGKKLGSVSQKNEIQAGSLDGAWGQTADAAAAAAAQGIVKLLPQPKTQTN